ncbi:hypothetical protein Cs7R123_49160 [Catellatospora sp. TT07R-123]|uniref:Mov34/MPN/PAD-1 family protein n=1 Tax=Catellatospora sp. TT07R-123 TaxID=2733863 RepID=UPI001B1DD1E7|nr:Mov34/MPN/PAD-1 family protein [Catellatospora sp. TT07R-123]GHJ47574.1 hypothetical protein Cs7R123_49160 [Catellatospora sp. TT07R-123]
MGLRSQAGDTFRVMVYESDLDDIANWVLDYPERETGGDLFGFWTHSGSPAVQLTLGPGPRARHDQAAFFQDVDYLGERGRALQRQHGLQHIGDWHSHHQMGLTQPSGGDAATVYRTLEANRFRRFLVCIANIRSGDDRTYRGGRPVVTLRAYLFENGRREFPEGKFVVLPGESPMAASARTERILPRRRQPSATWHVDRADRVAGQAGGGASRAVPTGWHTSSWGTQFLRRFDELIRQDFASCKLVMTLDSRLQYQFAAGSLSGELTFPTDFPHGAVRLCAGGVDVELDLPRPDADRLFEAAMESITSGQREQQRELQPAHSDDGGGEVPDGLDGGAGAAA